MNPTTVFNDRRVCDECDIVFLLATETTENIEGAAGDFLFCFQTS